jgi:hypothetical protein
MSSQTHDQVVSAARRIAANENSPEGLRSLAEAVEFLQSELYRVELLRKP